jgi:hypothetical protein
MLSAPKAAPVIAVATRTGIAQRSIGGSRTVIRNQHIAMAAAPQPLPAVISKYG